MKDGVFEPRHRSLSTARAWCFPDETSEHADRILFGLGGCAILAPAIWSLELANAVLVGECKKRLHQPEIKSFTTLLENLSVVQDTQPASETIRSVLPLVRAHGLSAYDAAYLELSIRHSAPLTTRDAKLQKAATDAGIKIFRGEAAVKNSSAAPQALRGRKRLIRPVGERI